MFIVEIPASIGYISPEGVVKLNLSKTKSK